MRSRNALLLIAAIFNIAVCCISTADVSISVDVHQTGGAISPLLFGDQIQWKNFGQDLLEVDSLSPATGTLRSSLLDPLKTAGLTLLRYPGGPPSGFFHWNVSTGPFASRGFLLTDDLQANSTFQYQRQIPYYGVD